MTSCTGGKSIPIACDLTAIPLEVRQRHLSDGVRIFESAEEMKELPNGHAFRFANQPGIVVALATFVEYERLCCPFYTFEIVVEADSGSVWLLLTGDEDVKEFEKSLFGNLNEALRSKLINTGDDSILTAAVEESATSLAQVWARASTE